MNRRQQLTVMRAIRGLTILGALTLAGMAATLVVHGGWQAIAATVAIAAGVGFALTFLALRASSERPERVVAARPSPPPSAVPVPETARPATSGRRPLVPRTARTA
jgi:hypothetical protein